VISEHALLLDGKVIVDPSNPIGFDATGQVIRTLPDDQSAGSVVAALLPASTHYVKAFGTLSAETLAGNANRKPERAVLFYATDDEKAATTVERLIRAAGFDPFKVGGAAAAIRIEMPGGDLRRLGPADGLLSLEQARAAIDGNGAERE
jgi:8-hydroxy-5-deazaflavin:NADPH oxidoreductase